MKPTILYVDDEVENLIVFEASFEDEFDVLTANSGEAALELLQTQSVPVVVADHRMPGMSGVELCEILRREYPHTKRIILTGYSDSAAMLDAINKGQVFHFHTKPWEKNVLLQVLYSAIEAHRLSMTNMRLTDQLLVSQRCVTLGQMAAQIAHEIGNQIGMAPLIELIQEKYANCPDLLHVAELASEAQNRMVSLIDEIKRFVRFEQNSLERRPTELAPTLRELASFLRFDRRFSHSRFECRIESEPSVLGNKFKIQQVVVNLLNNAADAIADNEDGKIQLSLNTIDEMAVISVRDNGPGIAPEDLERIWHPFFTTKGECGNGLGLEICRQLVERHDGQIDCQSQLGAGCEFTIRIPLLDRNSPALAENWITEPRQTIDRVTR